MTLIAPFVPRRESDKKPKRKPPRRTSTPNPGRQGAGRQGSPPKPAHWTATGTSATGSSRSATQQSLLDQLASQRAGEIGAGGGKVKEPSEVTRFWATLSPDQRRQVKMQMWWAGLYGDNDPPALNSSMLTPFDMGALQSLIEVAEPNGGLGAARLVLSQMADAGVQQGVPLGRTPDDPAKAYEEALAKALQEKYDATKKVALGVEAENLLRQYAHNQGLEFNNDSYKKWASSIVSMDSSFEEIQRNILNNYVLNSFPSWRKELEAGATVKDLASPYISTMSRILELPDTDINLYDPHIKHAMQGNGTDEKVPMWRFEQELMNDSRWERTSGAKDAASNIASMLMNTFGVNA